MSRGFIWAEYVTDDGQPFALKVDADYFFEPARGWSASATSDSLPLPRGWKPRRVWGYDAAGNRQSAVVSTVLADLWTGVTTVFGVEANDNTVKSVTVVGRWQEQRRGPTAT